MRCSWSSWWLCVLGTVLVLLNGYSVYRSGTTARAGLSCPPPRSCGHRDLPTDQDVFKYRRNFIQRITAVQAHVTALERALERGEHLDNAVVAKLGQHIASWREAAERVGKEMQQAPGVQLDVPVQAAGGSAGCPDLQPVKVPTFCPPEVSNVQAWVARRPQLPWNDNGGQHRGQRLNKTEELSKPTYWCDKLTYSLEPLPSLPLVPDDLAIALFSGEQLFHSRAGAMRDTWLSRVPASHIYAATNHTIVGVTGLGDKHKIRPDTRSYDDVIWLNLHALADLYAKHPEKKWYYTAGCDTYVHVDYMLEKLSAFDHRDVLWLAPARYVERVPDDFMPFISAFNDTYKPELFGSGPPSYAWSSGAASWWFSHSLMQLYAKHIDRFMEIVRSSGVFDGCNCPDKLIGLFLSLLGVDETPVREWAADMDSYAADGLTSHAHSSRSFTLYHYLSPRAALLADWRNHHELIDRLVNTGNISRILEFTRDLTDRTFRSLIRRQSEAAYLAKKARVPFREYDIHHENLHIHGI